MSGTPTSARVKMLSKLPGGTLRAWFPPSRTEARSVGSEACAAWSCDCPEAGFGLRAATGDQPCRGKKEEEQNGDDAGGEAALGWRGGTRGLEEASEGLR